VQSINDPSRIEAHAGAVLTVSDDIGSTSVDLYSDAGLAAVSALWTKLSVHHRLMYKATWLGIPIIQLPTDILVLQELIWSVRPDVIVECGVAHGGSLILYASVLELIGKGHVVGVDVEIRPHNRVAIEAHALAKRITLIEGSSIAPATVEAVKAQVGNAATVMVMVDSNHTTDHVYAELQAYADLVTPNSYFIVMDGAQALVSDVPGGKPEWKESSPLHAIERFLRERPDYEVDDNCTRFGITSNTRGYLRRTGGHA
jgi:cephalosporin hydroxylase